MNAQNSSPSSMSNTLNTSGFTNLDSPQQMMTPQAMLQAINSLSSNHPNYSMYMEIYRKMQVQAMRSRSNNLDPSIFPIVSNDRIKQLLKRIDPEQRLDADVEDILFDLTGEFIKNVSKTAIQLARHRLSDTLEAADAMLIVGFGMEEESKKKKTKNEGHAAKIAVVREAARKQGAIKRSLRLKARQAKQAQ
ncbi:Transcription initiation factor TFIID subunit 12 [Globomyces sp. JEL0801]|nr:Transcription initiation factor TFIID subunit 12 [Globomyces sp. JEL0801]